MSKTNKQQVPKIRFDGFSENWELKKLGQLVFSLDAGVSVNSVDNETSNYWILKTSCITGGIFNKNERKAVVDQNEIIRLKEPLLSNSILMSRMNTPTLVGVTGYVEEATHNTFLPDRLWQFKLKENKVDVCWLSNLFLTEKNLQIRQSNATGTSGSMKNISKASVLQEEIFLTSLIEQTQIGNFFQQIDKLIELQTRAVESAETYKKAMLQKMFPQKGEKVPRVRFEGFSGDLYVEKANNIFKTISEKNHANLPVLSATQDKGIVFRDVVGIDIQYDKESLKNYKKISKNQFVIHLRSFQGGLAFSEIEGISSPAYTVIDFLDKKSYEPVYWKYLFMSQNFINRLESITYGVRDGRSISFSDFSTLVFSFPELEEQTQIGNFFQKLDQNIEAEKKKLEQYQTMKRAMLQRMFV